MQNRMRRWRNGGIRVEVGRLGPAEGRITSVINVDLCQ